MEKQKKIRRRGHRINTHNAVETNNSMIIETGDNYSVLTAVEEIAAALEESGMNQLSQTVIARPVEFLKDKLSFSEKDVMVYVAFMSMYFDHCITLSNIATFLSVSPFEMVTLMDNIDRLCRLNYISNKNNSFDNCYQVTDKAIVSMRENRAIIPESYKAEDIYQWFDRILNVMNSNNTDEEKWDIITKLIENNHNFRFVKKYLTIAAKLNNMDQYFLLWACSILAVNEEKTFTTDDFWGYIDSISDFRTLRRSLTAGNNKLLTAKLIQEYHPSGGAMMRGVYSLTPSAVKKLFSDIEVAYNPNEGAEGIEQRLKKYTDIIEKPLFFNPSEQLAIDKLCELLQPKRFNEVKIQLQNKGFRNGFACLFYGAPGTGKTETVLQLARKTGRNIMQVNISQIKSKYVGDSEKNIKMIFDFYRQAVRSSEVAPILLFNEADAIIGKRLGNVSKAVDKMENAIQNIILEEIEGLEGILIATTNLVENMDSAFERRFLYKIEFSKPSVETKSAIWRTMIPELTEQEATTLATKYNFSGGQIENIARKRIVDSILDENIVSLESLCSHCDKEVLYNNNQRRVVGF